MKIFISWSGERSNMIATALKSWLEKLFQTADVFMSESDIEPGTRWAFRLNDELQISNYGIICLTPENQNSQWILFEAGALSNQVKNRVTPLLFNLNEGEVKGPLSQFQYLKADKLGFTKLANAVNKNLDRPLSNEKIAEYFQVWWNELHLALGGIPAEAKEAIPDKRKDRELIEEILQYTRNQTLNETKIIRLRKMTESEFRKMNSKDLVEYIQNAITRMGDGIAPSEIIQMKKQIILAAMILKENFPTLADIAEQLISSFPGIQKPLLK